jgi:hypothetical protein
MTLVLTIKVKEGLVLAADSRTNFTDGRPPIDNAFKLLTFKNHKHVAALVSGDAMIEGGDDCAPNELLPRLEAKLPLKRLSIFSYSEWIPARFQECYQNAWERLAEKGKLSEKAKADIIFHVAGFDENDNSGRVYKVTLIGRTNRSYYPFKIEPKFNVGGKEEILKENACCIACGGKSETFQKFYNEYFSNNKKLTQNLPPSDGTCEYRMPDKTSLEEARTLACSLMRRAISVNAEIGGQIRACTITQDGGLIMFDCDDLS